MYHSFFIHSSVSGHVGYFHVLAIANSAAMNIGVHVSFSILVSSEYMPSSGIAGSYGHTHALILKVSSVWFLIYQIPKDVVRLTLISYSSGKISSARSLDMILLWVPTVPVIYNTTALKQRSTLEPLKLLSKNLHVLWLPLPSSG